VRIWQRSISFGHDPLLFLVGGTQVQAELSEYAFAGGLRGAPVQVLLGERTGLPLPADTELAIEGEICPDLTLPEGPFGEFTGYYASAVRDEFALKVQRVMHRADPVITAAPPSLPNDSLMPWGVLKSALLWNQLEGAGIPDVRGVWFHEAASFVFLVVVSIHQRYAGHARQALHVAAGCHAANYLGRYVVVVDEDIEPSDLEAVTWALGSRSDPSRSIDFIPRSWSGPLDPAIPADQKGYNSRALIDACRPYEWREQFPGMLKTPAALRQQVVDRWSTYIRTGQA
jgi:4-hydroxy-3-polyprenylbenzoate decarboxylase